MLGKYSERFFFHVINVQNFENKIILIFIIILSSYINVIGVSMQSFEEKTIILRGII